MDVRWAFELFEEEVCHIRAADGEPCAARQATVRNPVASCERTVRQPRRSHDGPVQAARQDYAFHLGRGFRNVPQKGTPQDAAQDALGLDHNAETTDTKA